MGEGKGRVEWKEKSGDGGNGQLLLPAEMLTPYCIDCT